MTKKLFRRPRTGLSITELLGCLLCVAGGVWIGANYLGVDLNRAAYRALDETELLTQIPDDWRPENPDCPDGDCPDPTDQRSAEVARLNAELDALRVEVARLESGQPEPTGEEEASLLGGPLAEARQRSVSYWRGLAEIVDEVEALQARVSGVRQATEQARIMVVKRRALAYGKRAIELLDAEGVDEQAIDTGARIAQWYDQSEQAISKAGELSVRQTVDGRTFTAEEIWSQTEREHAKRTELVRRKANDAHAYLNSRYLVEFPALAL